VYETLTPKTESGKIAWCARVSAVQKGTADVVLDVIGGTRFYGQDGTVLIMSPDAGYLVSIDSEGRTKSARVNGDHYGRPVWAIGYVA
jgi:hypothetical protein